MRCGKPEIRLTQSEDFKFSGIIPDGIEFKLIRFLGLPRRGGKGNREKQGQAPRTEPVPVSPGFPAEFFRTGQINNHRRATSVSSQVDTTSGRDLRIKWK